MEFELIDVTAITDCGDWLEYTFLCDFLEGAGPEEATYVWRDSDAHGANSQEGLYWQLHAWRLSNPEFPISLPAEEEPDAA